MRLELISRRAQTPVSETPLLFVHGAWHGAWCWSEHVLDQAAARGYDAYALSLRGHGESEGAERLRWWRIADYVADVKQVVAGLPRTPVVIGHSMGGFVVQKYLETERPPAAVLLSSVAPHGIVRAYLKFARRHPIRALKVILLLSPYQVVATHELAREMLYPVALPRETTAVHYARLQEESFLAFMDMFVLNLPRPKRVTTPLLIASGTADRTIPVEDVEATARAYGTRPVLLDGMTHNLMLDIRWQEAIDLILDWINTALPPESLQTNR